MRAYFDPDVTDDEMLQVAPRCDGDTQRFRSPDDASSCCRRGSCRRTSCATAIARSTSGGSTGSPRPACSTERDRLLRQAVRGQSSGFMRDASSPRQVYEPSVLRRGIWPIDHFMRCGVASFIPAASLLGRPASIGRDLLDAIPRQRPNLSAEAADVSWRMDRLRVPSDLIASTRARCHSLRLTTGTRTPMRFVTTGPASPSPTPRSCSSPRPSWAARWPTCSIPRPMSTESPPGTCARSSR